MHRCGVGRRGCTICGNEWHGVVGWKQVKVWEVGKDSREQDRVRVVVVVEWIKDGGGEGGGGDGNGILYSYMVAGSIVEVDVVKER